MAHGLETLSNISTIESCRGVAVSVVLRCVLKSDLFLAELSVRIEFSSGEDSDTAETLVNHSEEGVKKVSLLNGKKKTNEVGFCVMLTFICSSSIMEF